MDVSAEEVNGMGVDLAELEFCDCYRNETWNMLGPCGMYNLKRRPHATRAPLCGIFVVRDTHCRFFGKV